MFFITFYAKYDLSIWYRIKEAVKDYKYIGTFQRMQQSISTDTHIFALYMLKMNLIINKLINMGIILCIEKYFQ